MSKLIMYEWRCNSSACNCKFDELAHSDVREIDCPCGQSTARRLISMGRIDPKLGLDPDFGTMADKWARTQTDAARKAQKRAEEHGDEY